MQNYFCFVLPAEDMEVSATAHTWIFQFELSICINSISNIRKVSLISSYRLKRKVKKKKWYPINTEDARTTSAVLIICCYRILRLCTEKLLNERSTLAADKEPISAFSWLWTATEVRSQWVSCQRPCKGTRRNIKGEAKMHTHYIKVYHEINVTPVQKRKLKIDFASDNIKN